jgi:uncharacterized protein (TIGR04255 family)
MLSVESKRPLQTTSTATWWARATAFVATANDCRGGRCLRAAWDDAGVSPADLPQFDRPPVNEIVGAAQFVALPRFGLPEIVKVGQALGGYELRELQPQLPPIQEGPPGQAEPPQLPQFFFGLGAQSAQRALYFRHDDRFVAQLQRDRIAINERRTEADASDPSSENVWPNLHDFSNVVASTLIGGHGETYGPHKPTFVELTYVNTIVPAPGVWEDHTQLHRVLRVVSVTAGDEPYARPERASVQFSFPLTADNFRGRLHVAANPGFSGEGVPVLNLNVVSRRLIDESESLATVFDACHCDAVRAFAAITTSRMHTIWGRTR